jgi:alpha-aminoadipic semialdehyde synthase
MRGFISAGLLDMTTPINLNQSGGWQSLLARTLSVVHNATVKNNKASLESALNQLLNEEDLTAVLDAAEWSVFLLVVPLIIACLSVLFDRLSIIPNFSPLNSLHTNSDLPSTAWSLPTVPPTPTLAIDLFARLLAHKLRYLPGESDSVILSHEIVSRSTLASQSSSGTQDELIHTSTLLLRQPHPTTSAMAVTVALPVALAALRVLDGHVKTRGVVGPTADKEIYLPILQEMSNHGLIMKEETKRRRPGLGLAGSMLDSQIITHHALPMNRRLHA